MVASMQCTTCGASDQEKVFGKSGMKRRQCRECINKYAREYFRRNPSKFVQKSRISKTRQRDRLRRLVLEVKTGRACLDCQIILPHYVLDFDHRDGTVKMGNIADLVGKGVTDKVLLDEIAKCDVVCANCHRVRTYNRNNHYQRVAQPG